MRARIANSGMDFWAMLGAAALATLLLVAATQLQAQTYPVPHNFSRPDGMGPPRSASMHGSGNLCAAPQRVCTGSNYFGGCETVLERMPEGSAWAFFPSTVGGKT